MLFQTCMHFFLCVQWKNIQVWNNLNDEGIWNEWDFHLPPCVHAPNRLMMFLCRPIIFIISISDTRSERSFSVASSRKITNKTENKLCSLCPLNKRSSAFLGKILFLYIYIYITKNIGVHFTNATSVFLLCNFMFNSLCFLTFLCDYLWNLLTDKTGCVPIAILKS